MSLDFFVKKIKHADTEPKDDEEVPKESSESTGSRTPDTVILSENEDGNDSDSQNLEKIPSIHQEEMEGGFLM